MAGKIQKETKDAIIRAYKNGNRSKADLAREFELSSSSISRILAGAGTDEKKKENDSSDALPNQTKVPEDPSPEKTTQELQKNPVSSLVGEVEHALSEYAELSGDQNIESLVHEFISWISKRDRGEKELISLEMAIESMRHEKNSIENEIGRLGSKAGSLEILIGKLRKLAEDSQMDLSLVEERLSNIEEKLSIDHDILLIGSAIRMILRGEELDEELVSMIADISNLNTGNNQDRKDTVRRALSEYSEFFRRRISK